MADKSRERNSAGLYSDYGLDERQKSIMADIGFKGFRTITFTMAGMTILWMIVYFFDITVPFLYTAFSYYAASAVCMLIFEITAANKGVLNQVYSFSASTGGVISAVILTVITFIMIFRKIGLVPTAVVAVSAVVQIVKAVNAKRNFKVLDEQCEESETE